MASIVQMERQTLNRDWDIYERLLQDIQMSVASTVQEIEEQAQRIEEDVQRVAFYESYDDEQTALLIRLSSFFVVSCALFEFQLVQVCRTGRRISGIESPIDFEDRPIDNAKEYLSKFLNINGPFGSHEWERIRDYQQVRHKIIHAGGVIDPYNPSLDGNDKKKRKEREKRVEQYALAQGIVIPPGETEDGERIVRTLTLTPQFCYEALSTYRKFITDLIKTCEERGAKRQVGE